MPALALGIILHKRMTKRGTENSLNHNIKGHLTRLGEALGDDGNFKKMVLYLTML